MEFALLALGVLLGTGGASALVVGLNSRGKLAAETKKLAAETKSEEVDTAGKIVSMVMAQLEVQTRETARLHEVLAAQTREITRLHEVVAELRDRIVEGLDRIAMLERYIRGEGLTPPNNNPPGSV